MIDKIELFGKQIELKTHNCHLFDQEAQKRFDLFNKNFKKFIKKNKHF